MTRQNIRLKEFDHNIERIHIPSEAYLRNAPQLERDRAYFMSTDENGFINTGNYFSSEFKIVVVGDSFVENIFIDEISRFESILERKFIASGSKVKVINAGVSGMTGLGAFNLILNKIVKIKPDLIIFVQPSIDFSALLFEAGYFNDSKLFANLIPPREDETPAYETIQPNCKQIYNNIALISKVCRLYGIDLMISTCASDSSRRQLQMMNSILREEALNLEYELLDLDRFFEKGIRNFYDRQHLNRDGASKLADLLFSFLNEKYDILGKIKSKTNLREKIVLIQDGENYRFDKFVLPCNRHGKTESWISITTSPKKITNKNETKELSISFMNQGGGGGICLM